MYTKAAYVMVDFLAVIVLFFTLFALERLKDVYAKWLRRALMMGSIAVIANIFVALAINSTMAAVAYCAYFSTINWMLYFLYGFCMLYTEHDNILKKTDRIIVFVMLLDTISIYLNFAFGHEFYIYEATDKAGVTFFLTGFRAFYYVHLFIDYSVMLIAFIYIVYRIVKSYSLYRVKYVIILSVLLLIVGLNLAYMALSLVLDVSVVFYALAGALIYGSITIFVPRSLMNVSLLRAIDDIKEGLILFDINDSCIYANSFAKKRFDIDESTYNFSCEPISSVIKEILITGEGAGEVPYIKNAVRDGVAKTEHYRIKFNKLTDKNNRVLGSYFLIRDVTEEIYYLAAINEAKINADNANRAKSAFLANMSHEIRTPLNSILGLNEMILRVEKDEEIRGYAEEVKQSGAVLLSLINDILDFSKIEANKMELVRVEYNPHKLLRDIKQFFEQMAADKDLFIHINCDPAIPSVLYGDEKRIRQVLSNLVSNAIKYTKEGGVTVNVNCNFLSHKTVELLAEISDTGIGISESDLSHIFDSFQRVNEGQNATIQGTGLGLTITKDLVELMQGHIDVESAPGHGTTFKVSIPQTIVDRTPLGAFAEASAPSTEDYHESFRAPDATILVVDDVKVNLKVVEALLKRTQIKVDKATGGAEAIRMCDEKKYDCVFLDHRMPSPDGVETFKAISVSGLNTDTPIIVLTANALSGADAEYKGIGFSDYLSKPIKSDELEAMLIKYLPKDKVTLV
ncbi:MAG: response regulator [Lachnospiraceae bacterium]|nr:response regulator [Lachnospiraceae bacterium]